MRCRGQGQGMAGPSEKILPPQILRLSWGLGSVCAHLHPISWGLPMAPQHEAFYETGGHLDPPLSRSLSQGPSAQLSCLAWEGIQNTSSPSWPTTGTEPAVTPCPSATPPVGGPSST
jgi:hypothetical protein